MLCAFLLHLLFLASKATMVVLQNEKFSWPSGFGFLQMIPEIEIKIKYLAFDFVLLPPLVYKVLLPVHLPCSDVGGGDAGGASIPQKVLIW